MVMRTKCYVWPRPQGGVGILDSIQYLYEPQSEIESIETELTWGAEHGYFHSPFYIIDFTELPYEHEGQDRKDWELFWRNGRPTVGLRNPQEEKITHDFSI